MKKWNVFDNFIFRAEERLGIEHSKGKSPKEEGSEPDEEVFNMAELDYYKAEYERLRRYGIPRPLVEDALGYRCVSCSREVFKKDTPKEQKGSYCRYCGQRFLEPGVSKAAARYALDAGDNRENDAP